MIRFHEAVVDILTDAPTIAELLPGGVWNRELRREGAGNTAAAWGPINASDPLSPVGLRPSVVVRDAGEFGTGFRFGADAKVMLFLYVPASDAGRALIARFDARLRALLDRAHLTVAAGDDDDGEPGQRVGEVRMEPRSLILDEPGEPGTMFTSWRLTLRTALLSGVAEW